LSKKEVRLLPALLVSSFPPFPLAAFLPESFASLARCDSRREALMPAMESPKLDLRGSERVLVSAGAGA
jgi:hypothetical protein